MWGYCSTYFVHRYANRERSSTRTSFVLGLAPGRAPTSALGAKLMSVSQPIPTAGRYLCSRHSALPSPRLFQQRAEMPCQCSLCKCARRHACQQVQEGDLEDAAQQLEFLTVMQVCCLQKINTIPGRSSVATIQVTCIHYLFIKR